jgi:hypothetical protein
MIILQSLRSHAQVIMRRVVISMPVCALMTTATVSTAGSALMTARKSRDNPSRKDRPLLVAEQTLCDLKRRVPKRSAGTLDG